MTEPTIDSPVAAAGDVKKPRTLAVLMVLVTAAATFSYLWAYAVTDALVMADVMPRWADGTDPRPRRMGTTFAGLLGAFVLAGTAARVLSGRQIRRIDAMTEE